MKEGGGGYSLRVNHVSPAVLSPRIFTTEMLAVHCRWGNGSEAKAPQSCQVLWTEKTDWKLDDSF